MYGIILDFYWNSGQDPVVVSIEGTLDAMQAVSSVDPGYVADTWPRSKTMPVGQHTVKSQSGGTLAAHICQRLI